MKPEQPVHHGNPHPGRHHLGQWPGLLLSGLLMSVATWAAADEFGYPDAETETATPAGDTAEPRSGPTGSIEPGLLWLHGTDGKSGEYNGLQSDGFRGVLRFEFLDRADWRSGDTRYRKASGRDIGTGTGDLFAEIGEQGAYKLRFGFRQIEHVDRNDAISPFTGSAYNLTLPAGFNAADRSFYNDADLGVKRESISLYGERILDSRWTLITDISHETKQGDKPTAAGQGFRGSAIAIQPIDYSHTQVDLRLRSAETRLQWEMGYYFSHFDNDDQALTFQNPFFAAADPQQLALPPENAFHQFSINGGYLLSERTRLNAYAAWSRALQDEAFLPYTVDAGGFYNFGGPEPPLPRNSLDGQVDQANLHLGFVTRVTRRWRVEGQYRFEDRDNRTPNDVYRFLHYNGNADDNWGNHVNSRSRHTFELETRYRLRNRMKVAAGYQHQRTHRDTDLLEPHHHHNAMGVLETTSTLTNRSHMAREDEAWSEIRFPPARRLSTRIKISAGKRSVSSSSAYDLHNEDHDATAPAYLLDREHVQLEAAGTWQASDRAALSASWQNRREVYNNSAFGADRVDSDQLSLDLALNTGQPLSGNLFLALQHAESSQNSRNNGGDRNLPVSGRWSLTSEDTAYHAGFGIDWRPTGDDLEVGLDYTFMDTENAIRSVHQTTGSDHLPDTETRIHRFSLNAEVPVENRLTVVTGYQYQRYDSENWSWSEGYFDVLGFGWNSPNHSAHAVMLGVRLDF